MAASTAAAHPPDSVHEEADAFFTHYNPAAPPTAAAAKKRLADAAGNLWAAACRVVPPNPSTPVTMMSSPTASLVKPLTIDVGKMVLTESEKWKLQAAMRREETKVAGKEYNKKLLRATKQTKGPVPGEGFPPGRGRPVR
jgi:hypothetical protein